MNSLEDIFEVCGVGIAILSADHRILRSNPAFRATLGREVEGQDYLELVHPEDRVAEHLKLVELAQGAFRLPASVVRFLHADHPWVWCRTTAARTEDASSAADELVITLEDISAEKRRDEDIRAQHASYEQMFQTASSAIAVTDAAGVVKRIYPGFTRLFGYSPAEALERPIAELIATTNDREIRGNLAAALAGNAISCETVRHRKDGSEVHVSVLGRSFQLAGGEPGIFLLYRDISERKEAEALIQRLSTTDELTGLWNRRGFQTLAQQEVRRARRQRVGLVLVYADLDGMKRINDQFGHQEGDWVLTEVAHVLRDSCRGSDTVARMGGDEFVVLAAGISQGEQIVADRIQRAVQKLNSASDKPYEIRISLGTVYFEPNEEDFDLDAMLVKADRRMYAAKARSRSAQRRLAKPGTTEQLVSGIRRYG